MNSHTMDFAIRTCMEILFFILRVMVDCLCLPYSSGVVRVADDAGSTTKCKRGEVHRFQLPYWSTQLVFAVSIMLVVCGNCVTVSVGHKFNVELALRWIVVCLASFVLYIVFDTIKVRFTANLHYHRCSADYRT